MKSLPVLGVLVLLVLAAVPADAVPSDVPLYPGLTWRSAAPVVYPGSPLPRSVSVRTKKLLGKEQAVETFYEKRMLAAGWKSSGTVGGHGNWHIEYRKGRRLCIVSYQSAPDDQEEGLDPAGPRIEITWSR